MKENYTATINEMTEALLTAYRDDKDNSLYSIDGQYLTNLFTNADFSLWTNGNDLPPDHWDLLGSATSTTTKETEIIKYGNSVKFTTLNGYTTLDQEIHATLGIAYWRGKTVTFGCWVKADLTGELALYMYDGVTDTIGNYYPNDNEWHYLTVTKTISNSATMVQPYIVVRAEEVIRTSYMNSPFIFEGSSLSETVSTQISNVASTSTIVCDRCGFAFKKKDLTIQKVPGSGKRLSLCDKCLDEEDDDGSKGK